MLLARSGPANSQWSGPLARIFSPRPLSASSPNTVAASAPVLVQAGALVRMVTFG